MTGALDGISVIDLSWGIAGPMATMMLADNGAAVTRIESPRGDPFANQSGYTVWQRGKRHALLDLTETADRNAFMQQVASADVIVHAFGEGVAAKLGIDHDSLANGNPRLISCALTGYGPGNSHSSRPGYDALVAARTGLFFDQRGRRGTAMEYIAGRTGPHPEFDAPEGMRRGTDRPGPVFPRSTWPSLGAALLSTLGITAALRAREVTGQGQEVGVSLLQGALAAVALNWQRVEHPDAPLYWMWPVDSRSIEGLFECSDGRWVHHWTVRPNWVRTVSAGERLDVPDPEHSYRNDPDRLGMEATDLLAGSFLYPELAAAFARFPADEWVDVGARSKMGVAKVRSPAEALADPAFLADGCVVEVDHPDLGPIRHVGNVIELSATPGAVSRSVSRRGAHTAELRSEAAAGTTLNASSSSSASSNSAAPLAGIRVIDLGLGVAGPFAPRLLADLGADVVKVHALHDTYWSGTHMGLGTNRGKRSIAINLKDPRGLAVLRRLVDTADVLASNWRPGAMARLGLDEATLRRTHPHIVICNSRGYEKGPRSDLPGTDQTANALCGTEWEDGACDAGNPPLWSRSGMGDTGNALLSAIGIAMALFHRQRSGVGQSVSTSIVNACLLNTSYAWIHAEGTPGEWDRVDGEQWGLHPLYRIYQTSDGWITLAAVGDEAWRNLRVAIGQETMVRDRESLATELAAWFAARTCADAFDTLDGSGVPIEIVNETFCRTMFDDPDLIARGLVAQTHAGGVGTFEDPGLLIDFSTTPGTIQRGPCRCGEHTVEILGELGLDTKEVRDLIDCGVVLDGRA